MSGDIAALTAEIVPYMSAAASAYGGAVLATLRDDTAGATVGLGRRLLQRIFGIRTSGEEIPEPLADIVANPQDEDAAAALRLVVRKALQASPTLLAEVEGMLAHDGVRIIASGERSVSAETISGTAITGDQPGGLIITGGQPTVTMNIGGSHAQGATLPTRYEPERVVQLSSLLPPGAGIIIRGRDFVDVKVVGPAFVIPLPSFSLTNCTFQNDIAEMLWEISPMQTVIGAIGLENCSFLNCTFSGITFMGTREFIDLIKKDLGSR